MLDETRRMDVCMAAVQMRKYALEMASAAKENAAHIGAGFSLIDILAVLYTLVMRHNPKNPTWEERDRFILSKGHGVLGYYAALAYSGYFPEETLASFECADSILAGHPVRNRRFGIEFTNGSLGMGLSLGIGVALSAKKQGKDYQVYVLLGDGECGEGSVWEAAMLASHLKLDNLTVVVDKNSYQLGGLTAEILNSESLTDKFAAFGWNTTETDGHDYKGLYNAFTSRADENKPKMIQADTIKGKGISFFENNNAWHHAVLTSAQYADAILELEGVKHGIE